MKAYLFIETGEVRPPKVGDWVKDDEFGGDCCPITNERDLGLYFEDYPILTRHEIEIPDGAHSLCIDPVAYGKQWGSTSIPIPRPKKKVKKWIYEFTLGGIAWRTVSPLSEEEYNQQSMTGHKVDGTMVEEEA